MLIDLISYRIHFFLIRTSFGEKWGQDFATNTVNKSKLRHFEAGKFKQKIPHGIFTAGGALPIQEKKTEYLNNVN